MDTVMQTRSTTPLEARKPHPTREMNERKRQREGDSGEKCIVMSSLPTTFRADTVAFGSMFTIRSYGSALSIFSMELNMVPVDPTGMNVVVYTKLGEFEGFEDDPSAWDLVSDSNVLPAREGKGSVIAEEDFTTIDMGRDEIRSLYVTLTSSDLRYTRARQGVVVGDEVASDGYLSVHVGVGLGDVPFTNRVFNGRLFNGIFHYRHAASCDEPMTRSKVTLSFIVGKAGLVPSSSLGEQASASLQSLLQSLLDGDLSIFQRDYLLALEKINTTFVSLPDSEGCPESSWTDCARLTSTVTFVHRRSLASGHAKYIMLQRSKQIEENLSLGGFNAVYVGERTLNADVVLTLEGVPPSEGRMNTDQQRYFEQVVTRFLTQELLGILPVTILGAKIRKQGPETTRNGRGLRVNQRLLQSSSIDVSTSVLGLYDPPRPDDFPLFVVSAVRQYRDGLRDDLVNSRDIPGSIVEGFKGDYFANIRRIDARVDELSPTPAPTLPPTPRQPPTQPATTFGIPTVWFILGCVALILVSIAWLWYYMKKEDLCCNPWRNRRRHSTVRPTRSHCSRKRRIWTIVQEGEKKKKAKQDNDKRKSNSTAKGVTTPSEGDKKKPDTPAGESKHSDKRSDSSRSDKEKPTDTQSNNRQQLNSNRNTSIRGSSRSSMGEIKETPGRGSTRSSLGNAKDPSTRGSKRTGLSSTTRGLSARGSKRSELGKSKDSSVRHSKRSGDLLTMPEDPSSAHNRKQEMGNEASTHNTKRAKGLDKSKERSVRASNRTLDRSSRDQTANFKLPNETPDRGNMRGTMDRSTRNASIPNQERSSKDMRGTVGISANNIMDESTRAIRSAMGDKKEASHKMDNSTRALKVDLSATLGVPVHRDIDASTHAFQGSSHIPKVNLAALSTPEPSKQDKSDRRILEASSHSKRGKLADSSRHSKREKIDESLHKKTANSKKEVNDLLVESIKKQKAHKQSSSTKVDPSGHGKPSRLGESVHEKKQSTSKDKNRLDPPEVSLYDKPRRSSSKDLGSLSRHISELRKTKGEESRRHQSKQQSSSKR